MNAIFKNIPEITRGKAFIISGINVRLNLCCDQEYISITGTHKNIAPRIAERMKINVTSSI